MNSYRVTKYNPKNRDDQGRYRASEWTSISDIGQKYCGHVLTEEKYEEIENSYLDIALAFLKEAGVTHMVVKFDPGEISPPRKYRHGDAVDVVAVRKILRSLLREHYWCCLESGSGAFIHVGYDYYMYVGSPTEGSKWKALATARNLFVEEICASPYKTEI